MLELIRSVVSRLRVYFKDRRRSPRLRVRLLFTVSIHRATNGDGSGKRAQTLKGHTRDISVKGLALLVPQIHFNGYHLAAEGRELKVDLDIGGGLPISILVVPRRYERLEEAELGCNYLIGARILKLDEEDRVRYLSLISESLARQQHETRNKRA